MDDRDVDQTDVQAGQCLCLFAHDYNIFEYVEVNVICGGSGIVC